MAPVLLLQQLNKTMTPGPSVLLRCFPIRFQESKLDIRPTVPSLTDADEAALEATLPLAPTPNPPHGLKHTLDTYAARTKANIA